MISRNDRDNCSANYHAEALLQFATDLLNRAGLELKKSKTVATVLVEGDLMGLSTHGLALLPRYLEEVELGEISNFETYDVVSDCGTIQVWDGKNLPGPWLMVSAVETTIKRAKALGQGTTAIRNAHHTAALATYLTAATSKGLMIVIACSDPASASVAPFGGAGAVFTPNPLAIGIPTGSEPILIDMSSSITTNGMSRKLYDEGRLYPGYWAIDAAGQPSRDPAVLYSTDGGALLPAGGLDHGQKGFGLALFVEALTQGLSAFGRADHPTGRKNSVFIQIWDPTFFGGLNEFERQVRWTVQACHSTTPINNNAPVRMPGERAISAKHESLRSGIPVEDTVMNKLKTWAKKLDVQFPDQIGQH